MRLSTMYDATAVSCNGWPWYLFAAADAGLAIAAPVAGMKWTMMRHGNKVKHLGRPADQRKALIRALVTETLRHGQIRTTKVGAVASKGSRL